MSYLSNSKIDLWIIIKKKRKLSSNKNIIKKFKVPLITKIKISIVFMIIGKIPISKRDKRT